ncbi:putative aldehyde dehydrogenase DhaS [Streptomyces humidus]|uniref:Aldehyde dehydrogenase DhaS n=1 Tax=Streptomyces humidus TaxID=52259 RepID=A0A918G3Q4_9ACTN|nr:aldehyde dehydrogenase family protein [Streptomyces humidus]GGS16918.1 putative aldehyde dehydrogenase DhaS [Streptomyces humidus]
MHDTAPPPAPETGPAEAHEKVRRYLSEPRTMLVGGAWVPAVSGGTFDTLDPATGTVLTQVSEGDAADVDRAVAAARRAFQDPRWRRMSAMDRGQLLHRIADLIEANADELALLESRDNGKPVSVARAVDVGTSVKMFRYFAGWPTKIEGSTIPVSPRGGMRVLNYTTHQPVGVVGLIVPWNFPMSMACWKLAPALAMGCTVVLKPAEETPLSTLRLAEILTEAGLPDGVVNVVTGRGATAGAALAAHDGVDKIAFTGSTETGRAIVRAAAGNLKKVSLELGGKSPNIVLPDADPQSVAEAAAQAVFFNQGQVCTAGSRLYVHDAIYDEVVDAVAEQARKIVVGPGSDPATGMGPLVSARHHETVSSYIESGRQQGARLATGGRRPELPPPYAGGYFLEPTVFAEAEQGMRIVQEEIFGPVLAALRWSDVDDLVAKANDTPFGLSAGIWTSDLGHAHRIADDLQAGTVWINCFNLTDPASPFGGFKQSGWGREMGRKVLDLYTEVKSVWVNLD